MFKGDSALIMEENEQLDKDVLNLLKRLGLNQYESKVYTSLLFSGTSTAGEISEKAEVPRSRVYDVLNSLEDKGFALVESGRPVKYRGVSIESALSHLKTSYEEKYKKKMNEVERLKGELKDKVEKAPADYLSEGNGLKIIKGKDNLYNHINKMIDGSESHVLKMTNSYGLQNLDKHSKDSFQDAKKRGIDARIIAHFDEKPNLKNLHKHADIKEGTGNEGRFMISDGKEVVLLTHPEDSGIWVNSPYLAGCMESLFNHAWQKGNSVPY